MRNTSALMLLLGIAACGGADAPSSAPTPDAGPTNEPVQDTPSSEPGQPDASVRSPDAAATPVDAGGVPQLAGYTLVFDDEFDDLYAGKPNPEVWDYDLGVINGELQCYTDARPENVRLETRDARSVLVLQTRKESYACPQANDQQFAYTSGGLHSRHRDGHLLQDFSFGHYEIAAKIPSGRGTWPALWLLGQTAAWGWPNAGEIDIMEMVGYEEANGVFASHSTLHRSDERPWPTDIGGNGMGHTITFPQALSGAFHVWALDWTPSTLEFYVDGTPVTTRGIDYQGKVEEHERFDRADIPNSADDLGWPFARGTEGAEFELILNLAFGGNWGGLQGVDDTLFDQGNVELLVDYVRVYRKDP